MNCQSAHLSNCETPCETCDSLRNSARTILPELLNSLASELRWLCQRFRTHLLIIFLAPFLAATIANAQALPSETDRLVSTGRLWISVNYFHPLLADRKIDWDRALVEALPKIRAAKTSAEYEQAVRGMLTVLDAAHITPGTTQRIWLHHGLTREVGEPTSHFYSAFLYKSGNAPLEANVPMGGFSVKIYLSDTATGPVIPEPFRPYPPGEAYPPTELRILAAYKIWGVFHYFFAYRDLMDEDWDALLQQYLPRFIAAKDALEYNLAIAEWLTHAADSLATVNSPAMTNYFGEAPVGLRLRVVEKHVVITEVLDPAATQAGIKIGDVVKTVDGVTLVEKFKLEEQYVSASTLQRLTIDVAGRLLNGPDNSTAALTLEDHAGNRKELTLKRSKQYIPLLQTPEPGETLRLLRGGVGYADLRKLKRTEVDAMFEKFRHTPAIIFDMRGVPADDCVAAIAPRLSEEQDVPAAIVTGPIVATPDLQQGDTASPSSSYFFIQTLNNSSQWKYQGKTVLLIDERTIGAGEHAGLLLEAANKTTFVGTPTAGADTVVTNFTVPGGITISLSGEDIRHANGGKLQRMGLQPNINAAPTLTGIRTVKDELLDRALDEILPKPPSSKPQPSKADVRALTGL